MQHLLVFFNGGSFVTIDNQTSQHDAYFAMLALQKWHKIKYFILEWIHLSRVKKHVIKHISQLQIDSQAIEIISETKNIDFMHILLFYVQKNKAEAPTLQNFGNQKFRLLIPMTDN